MGKQKDNFLVSLLKKSLGMPTGESRCGCGTPVAAAPVTPPDSSDAIHAAVPERLEDIARSSGMSSCGCGSSASDRATPSAVSASRNL